MQSSRNDLDDVTKPQLIQYVDKKYIDEMQISTVTDRDWEQSKTVQHFILNNYTKYD